MQFSFILNADICIIWVSTQTDSVTVEIIEIKSDIYEKKCYLHSFCVASCNTGNIIRKKTCTITGVVFILLFFNSLRHCISKYILFSIEPSSYEITFKGNDKILAEVLKKSDNNGCACAFGWSLVVSNAMIFFSLVLKRIQLPFTVLYFTYIRWPVMAQAIFYPKIIPT